MNCSECRQQLLVVGGEEQTPEAARQHLATCAECQRYFREEERLRAQIRKVAEGERAPDALRERVGELMAGEIDAAKRPRMRRLGAAAAVVFVALGGYALQWYTSQRVPSPDRLAQVFIADHLHYLPGREEIVSESAKDVERWFQGRIDFPVRVPTVPAAALQDARVCKVAGRTAALVHYRRKPDDTLISLFVAEAPRTLTRAKSSETVSSSYQGCNAALWCDRGLVYSLVAALDDASLKQLADAVRRQESQLSH